MKSWLFLLFLALPLGATTFRLQTADQQLREADGVLIGHYLKKQYIKLDNGRIATQMIFQMKKEYGLQSDLFGGDEVIVHYPGGKFADQTIEVHGVPRLIPGEQVVIFTKTVKNRYWGLNLGMGTYKIVNYGQDSMLVNSLFPENPQMGQLRMDQLERLVRTVKGSSLKVVIDHTYAPIRQEQEGQREPASLEEGKIRTIASNPEEVDNNDAGTPLRTFWLVFFLGVLGASFRFVQSRMHK